MLVQNQSMSLPPQLQGSTSPVSAATDGQSGPGKDAQLLLFYIL